MMIKYSLFNVVVKEGVTMCNIILIDHERSRQKKVNNELQDTRLNCLTN